MTTKKRFLSILLIALVTVCLLTGFLFYYTANTVNSANTAYASRDSNGTNTDGEWTGTQQTPNLIPTLTGASIASQGWRVAGDSNSQPNPNGYPMGSYGYVISAQNDGDELGNSNCTGGVYYTLTLSEADKVKANAGQLQIGGKATFYYQGSSNTSVSIRAEFYDATAKKISDAKYTQEKYFKWGGDVSWDRTLSDTQVPNGTCTIQVWFSSWNSLAGKPYIANPSCYLRDTTAPAFSDVTLEKTKIVDSNNSIAIAGDTIKYCIGFNEKVSITANGTAAISLNGTQIATSSNVAIETVNGKSRACYTFTLPDKAESGTIKLSSVSGLGVKDEAGNAYTYSGSPSSPTLTYYKTMTVSPSLSHLTHTGGGKATYCTDYTTTLKADKGYNLPASITVKVGGSQLSSPTQYTYSSSTGEVRIYGTNIKDDITITAAGVPITSTVTFNAAGGVVGTSSIPATYDAAMPSISMTPTLTGYTFQGYYTALNGGGKQYYDASGAPVVKICDFYEPLTLYAKWSANHYTIKFDQNKPSKASSNVQGSTADTPRIYDDGDIGLPKNGFTLTGWTFQGWATSNSGGVAYGDTQAVGNLTSDPNGTYTLYAVWKQNIYNITLNAMGGTNAGTKEATFDDPLPGITVPEKYGYNFVGYFDAPESGTKYYEASGTAAIPKFTVVDGITLYAQWSPITYTVRLYSEGEFVKDIPNVVYGELKLPTAEECGLARKNFDFVGWNIYAEQDWKMYSPDTTYTTGLTGTQGDIVVLNASWQEKPIHALYYDANGGYGAPMAMQVHEEDTVTLSAEVPTREDYTFSGWAISPESAESGTVRYSPEDTFTMGSGAVTLYAVWKHNPSLTYDANQGTFNHPVAVTYPAPASEVTVTELEPVRDGYTFGGWATSNDAASAEYHAKGTFSMPEDNTVLYAVWQQRQLTVSQHTAEGYSIDGLKEGYAYGEEVSFTVTGANPKVYINGQRVFDNDEGTYTYKATENISIVVADESSRVLLYSANGGEDAPTDPNFYQDSAEATVVKDIPKRTGYTFVGWSTTPEPEPNRYRRGRAFAGGDDLYQGGDSLTVQGDDVTLYAIWEANTYTVTYNGMGGDGTMTASSHSYGTPKNLDTNAYTKTGFRFAGWALSLGGASVFTDGEEVLNLCEDDEGNITLYAVWEQMKTLISFDAAGGAGGSSNYMVAYGDTLPRSGLMAPLRSGYTFAGYYTEEEGEGTMLFDENMRPVNEAASEWVSGDPILTLHAYWIPTPETIEDTIGEVQMQLYAAQNNLMDTINSNADDFAAQLEAAIEQLTNAYIAADEVVEAHFAVGDSRLEGLIDGLRNELKGADAALQSAIDALQTRLEQNVADLQADIDKNEADISSIKDRLSDIDATYKAADTAIRAEFAAADTGLQSNIDALRNTLTAADDVLTKAVEALKNELKQSVDDLNATITANKTDIESQLKQAIEAYEAADRAINGNIAALQAEDSELSQSISNLDKARQTAEQGLQDAIDALEAKLDQSVTDLNETISANKDDIEDKLQQAIDAYKAADTAIRSDITNLQNEDSALSQRISNLDQARQTAEQGLQDAIDALETKLDRAVDDLNATITANKNDIEDQLQQAIDAYKAADTAIRSEMADLQSTLSKSISDLDQARLAAEQGLQDAIDALRADLNQAVTDLNETISKNKDDIEDKLQQAIDAYEAADTAIRSEMADLQSTLSKSISDLDQARLAAERGLQNAIDAVQANLNQAVADLQKSITSNRTTLDGKIADLDSAYQAADAVLRSNMKKADDALDARITALEAAVKSADSDLQKAIDAVKDELKNAVADLQAAINANETDIEGKVADLKSAYQTANTLLRSDMKTANETLEAAMKSADSDLQDAIDTVEANLNQAVADLQAAIGTNETDIEEKVTALNKAYNAADALIKSDITGLKAQGSVLAQSIAALDSAYKAADDALWEGIRQVEGKHDALEQESEKTALIYMIVNISLGVVAAGMIVTLVVKAVKKKKPQE